MSERRPFPGSKAGDGDGLPSFPSTPGPPGSSTPALFLFATLILLHPHLAFPQTSGGSTLLHYQLDPEAANRTFKVKVYPAARAADALTAPFSFGLDASIPSPTPASNLIDPERPADAFPNRITRIEDAFTLEVDLGEGRKFAAPTHLFGNDIKIVPYADSDDVKDAAGQSHRGDEAVARYFPPGEVGFAIKHHRPFNRILEATSRFGVNGSEDEIKLQDTHIEIVVGVIRNGKPGVITVNNPQNYQHGGFGDEQAAGDYPMIFCKPVFPRYLPAEARALLMDNIRTMAVGFNTVTEFPDDYDGGDPLAARSPEKIRENVKMMIQAVAGSSAARDYFAQEENYMYCAELAFVASSAGVLVPLNHQSVMKLGVSEREWAAFKKEVALHNKQLKDHPSFFVKHNDNPRIALVRLADLDKLDSLKSLPDYSNSPATESQKLAFQPMTMADIVDGFMRLTFPRKEMGEKMAPYQARILAQMKPGLLAMLATDPESPSGVAAGQLFDQLVEVVGKQYPDYNDFREALEPLLQQSREVTGGDGEGLFTPPSLFHLVLKGIGADGGLLRLEYVGHGLHFSTVKPSEAGPPSGR